ncbi:MAG: Rrf2 family transcriptional regulator [Polaribacter sp.]|nr:Rrf2 family transcriptional regulator [Polaribacter sp.]
MLSKSSKYGIRAVLYLASTASPTKNIGTKEIAATLNIPAPFLAKTLQQLSKKKIISSIKGPHGGFFMTNNNLEKSIFDIIYCIDGQHKFEECFLGYPECSDLEPCVVHDVYSPLKKSLLQRLKTKTILEMAKESTTPFDSLENLIADGSL